MVLPRRNGVLIWHSYGTPGDYGIVNVCREQSLGQTEDSISVDSRCDDLTHP
jgi:hypothetical protein